MTGQQLLSFAVDHWPFVAAMAIFATLGQAMKGVFSKTRAANSTLWWWLRATMPLHPIAAGALLGLVPGVPTSAALAGATAAAKSLYFAGAGMASAYFFDLLNRLLLREGITVTHPKASLPPPPGP